MRFETVLPSPFPSLFPLSLSGLDGEGEEEGEREEENL